MTFTIEDDGQTIESAVQKLHSAILSDSLVIRDSNGTVLDIVKSSFSYRIVEKGIIILFSFHQDHIMNLSWKLN